MYSRNIKSSNNLTVKNHFKEANCRIKIDNKCYFLNYLNNYKETNQYLYLATRTSVCFHEKRFIDWNKYNPF